MDIDSVPSSASFTVAEAISQMATAVQNGDFDKAQAIGEAASVPLSIPLQYLKLGQPISEGAQASVYVAELEGHGPVAVKKAKIREHADLIRLRKEVIFLAEMTTHPHIVQLLGARMLPPHYQLVLGLEATNAAFEVHSNGWRPGWAGAIALGAQLASAVAHLHDNGIIHRDIKPANVLLSKDRRTARLADLGIAVRVQNNDEEDTESWQGAGKPSGGFYKRQMVGTLEYMAPEILLKAPHSPASDVFALATTINEVAAAALPYSDCTRDNPLAHTILEMGYGRQELAAAVAAEGLRPTIADGAPPQLARLLRDCWDADPERRPTSAVVVEKLIKLAQKIVWAVVDEETTNANGGAAATAIAAPTLIYPNESTTSLVDLQTPAWAAQLLENASNDTPFAIGSFATAGARGEDKMEDRCCIVRTLFGLEHCALAAVFDGHRGAAAADYLASSIERHIEARWADSTGPEELLRQALLDADAAFRHKEDVLFAKKKAIDRSTQRTAYPGSTAVVALFIGRQITVANLGDSRAVLCRGEAAVDLTTDQTAEREDERQRIQAAGGEVSVRMGGWRVGSSGLAVTRSIGDADVKNIGVSAEAETSALDLTSEDSFMVLASDGVWDLMTSQDAVNLVLDTVKQPAMCAQRVVMEALARGSKDNVSAIVAFFPGGVGTAERVYHAGKHKYAGTATAGASRVAARLVEDEIHETY